jgi:DnaJ-class molecular chaperone
VNVVIPRKLSAEQRQMLKAFAATLGDENLIAQNGDESLFSRVKRALR